MGYELSGWAAIVVFLLQAAANWWGQKRTSKRITEAKVAIAETKLGVEETKEAIAEHHNVVQKRMEQTNVALVEDIVWKQRVDHELQEVREWVKSIKREIQAGNGEPRE